MYGLQWGLLEDPHIDTDPCVSVYEVGKSVFLQDEDHWDNLFAGEVEYDPTWEYNVMPYDSLCR